METTTLFKRILPVFLLAMAIGSPVFAAPFLSTSLVTYSSTVPTEYLVTLDDGDEVESTAAGIKEVGTFTITAYDAATTYKATIGGVDVTQVGTGGTTTTTATAMTTALNASGDPGFAAVTWTSSGAVITGTADVGGVEFVPTTSKTSGTGTIGAWAETVDPSHYLLYDLNGIEFGTHTASVKAQNNTATSTAATKTFDVGVETPDLIVIPSAP